MNDTWLNGIRQPTLRPLFAARSLAYVSYQMRSSVTRAVTTLRKIGILNLAAGVTVKVKSPFGFYIGRRVEHVVVVADIRQVDRGVDRQRTDAYAKLGRGPGVVYLRERRRRTDETQEDGRRDEGPPREESAAE